MSPVCFPSWSVTGGHRTLGGSCSAPTGRWTAVRASVLVSSLHAWAPAQPREGLPAVTCGALGARRHVGRSTAWRRQEVNRGSRGWARANSRAGWAASTSTRGSRAGPLSSWLAHGSRVALRAGLGARLSRTGVGPAGGRALRGSGSGKGPARPPVWVCVHCRSTPCRPLPHSGPCSVSTRSSPVD